MKFKESLDKYEKAQTRRKNVIKQEPNKWKRFWMWVWFLIAWPFRWLWVECRDWRTFIIFVLTMAVVGSEVWVPLVLAWVFWSNQAVRASMLSVAGACETFWLLPGTPFIPLCIFITMGIKTLFDKLKRRREERRMHKPTPEELEDIYREEER